MRCHRTPLFIKLILAGALFQTQNLSAADWDYAADISGRTYSPGLSIDPTVGLHQLLWGEPTTPFFGYVRPAISASVSPSVFSGKAALDIFPLSFLGVTLARNWSHRILEATGYDCKANTCLGALNDRELTLKLLSAYESYFLSAQYQRIFYEANSEGDQNLMDPSNALIYRADGSNLNVSAFILGKKLSEKISAGMILQRGDLDRRISASEADYVFVRSNLEAYGYKMLTLSLGLGRFNTDIKRPGVSAIAVLTYTGKEGIGPAL